MSPPERRPRGDGQHALQQARQPQQHSTPQHKQRTTELIMRRTMREPTIIAAMTGHLRVGSQYGWLCVRRMGDALAVLL